jgi:hypothetical protein
MVSFSRPVAIETYSEEIVGREVRRGVWVVAAIAGVTVCLVLCECFRLMSLGMLRGEKDRQCRTPTLSQ